MTTERLRDCVCGNLPALKTFQGYHYYVCDTCNIESGLCMKVYTALISWNSIIEKEL